MVKPVRKVHYFITHRKTPSPLNEILHHRLRYLLLFNFDDKIQLSQCSLICYEQINGRLDFVYY